MKKGNLLSILFPSLGMLVLIFDGKPAVLGVQEGIGICLRTLIPSLFPFFVISGLITASLAGQPIPVLRSFCRICRIPVGCESLLAVGLLGGYPLGAKTVSDAYTKGDLSYEDAGRMAVFCNCAGPSFLFGVLGPLFPDIRWCVLLWVIQITGAILTGIILPGGSQKKMIPSAQNEIRTSDVMYRSIKSMAAVCGWVILFRMVLEFLNRWLLWLVPIPIRVLLTGILELSNGCVNLQQIQYLPLRFFLASVMLSAGGVCIFMQTKSVFQEMPMGHYLRGKLLQCSICSILTLMFLPAIAEGVSLLRYFIPLTGGLLLSSVLIFSRKRKKEVAIP